MAILFENITFNKLQNELLCKFLEKYTVNRSTPRKNYVDSCFNETINSNRK